MRRETIILRANDALDSRLAAMKQQGRHLSPSQPGLWIEDAATLDRITQLSKRLNIPKHQLVKQALAQLETHLDWVSPEGGAAAFPIQLAGERPDA